MPHLSKNPVAVSTVGNALAPLASLATAPILATALQTEGRGLVAAAAAPLLLAVALASLGLPTALTHRIAQSSSGFRPAFLVSCFVTAVAGAVTTTALIAAGPLLAGGHTGLSRLIGTTALALVPNLIAALLQAIAAGLHAWGRITLERMITQGVRLVVIGGCAMTGTLTVEVAVATIALTPVLGAAVYLPLLRAERAHAPGAFRTRTFLSYGGRVWLGALSGIVLSRLDQTLMVPLAGAVALGVYAVAVNIADVPLIVANAVREVSFSRHSAQEDHERLTRSARLMTGAVLVVSTGLARVAPTAVPWLFGDGFDAAVLVVLVLLLGLVLGSPGSLAGVGLAAAGRPGLRSTSLAVAALANVAVLIVLAPLLGAAGAAVATLVGNVVSAGLNLLFLKRVTGQRIGPFLGLRRDDLRSVRALLAR